MMNQQADKKTKGDIEKAFAKAVSAADFFVLRTANQSVSLLTDWQGEDLQSLRAQLNQWLSCEQVKEALYVASPSLVERLPYWQKDPDSKRGKKIEAVLVKYFIRMTSRATPFGLFASVGCGSIDEQSRLDIADKPIRSRKTRIDMGFLADRHDELVKKPKNYTQLPLCLNQSLYKMGEQWRFIESTMNNRKRQYRLSNAESDYFLDFVLNKVKQERLTMAQLAQQLCQLDDEIGNEEAMAYLTELVEEQLLIVEIPLHLTGKSPDSQFVETVKSLPDDQGYSVLAKAVADIEALDASQVNEPEAYEKIIDDLKVLDENLNRDKLFQIDSYRSSQDLSLSQRVVNDLKADLAKLYRLSSKAHSPIKDMIGRFNARFEGQAVPLSVLLDDEVGIGKNAHKGFESPLIGTLPINSGSDEQGADKVSWSKLDRMLLNKVMQNPDDSPEVVIEDSDLADFDGHYVEALPSSFSMMTTLYAKDAQALDNGEFVASLSGCVGPSAAKMLGRFCHLDEQLENKVKDHLRVEEKANPDAVYAEVVHLPQGRVGNVIARPVLRDHEIPFLTASGVDKDHQIAIDDIWVFVKAGRLVLWSKRLDKEVVPRLSSAHNYRGQSLGIYHFLCQLQNHGATLPRFSWSPVFASMAYLPRVRLGKLLLSLQTWRVQADELKAFKNIAEVDFAEKMSALREKHKLPRWVTFAVGDNTLQVDLNNFLAVSTFVGELKGNGLISLTEVLSEQLELAVSDDAKPLHHEIIVPFNADTQMIPVTEAPYSFYQAQDFERSHIPGGQWLMLKIYTGNTTCDMLIREKLAPLIGAQLTQTPCKSWFFMRYSDPDWHVRLRVNGEPEVLYNQLLPKLNALLKPLYAQGLVNKVEVATYERELSRYGGEHGMELSERYFQYDSECCAELMGILADHDADARWQTVVLGVHHMLNDFGFDREQCHQIVKDYRKSFGIEFNETAVLRKEMGKKYRIHDRTLQQLILGEPEKPLWQKVNQVFAKRKDHSRVVVAELRALADEDKLSLKLEQMVKSYLHMFMNRMFISSARPQELVVYDFLDKIYTYAKFQKPKS